MNELIQNVTSAIFKGIDVQALTIKNIEGARVTTYYLFCLVIGFFTLGRAEASDNDELNIEAHSPFKSNFTIIKGSSMHYLDEGDPQAPHTFVLLHGNPTSSYIWRNIVPHLTPHGRVIAPDLIGMGKSDKPDIDYTYADHIAYMDEFFDQLALDNIIFVVQDWGSAIGFQYAQRFPEKTKGIVMMEAMTRTLEWSDANMIERMIFKRLRDPEKGEKMIVKKNFFVKRFLPMMTKTKLSAADKAHYEAPFLYESDRKAMQVWPTQIPIGGEPAQSYQIIKRYEDWLPTSNIPKLLFHAKPGVIIKPKEAKHIIATWKHLEAIDLGKGKHFLQETYPHKIGEGIAKWYLKTYTNE